MFQNIWKDIKATKQIFTKFEKEQVKDNKINDLKSQTFASEIKTFLRTPKVLERWFWTWALFALYSSIKFVLMIPLDLLRILVSLILSSRGYTSKYSSWCSLMLILNLLIFTSDLKIFDISYMYHTFRGQSALKFYGLLFAFEISQKLCTLIGKKVFMALNTQLSSNNNIFKCSKQILCSFLYLVFHTLSIYLQYIVFIVIINSQISSFVIYFFVMNLTKMKSTAFKKMDNKGYSAQINYDMKDRLNKIIYIILFISSQSSRQIDQYSLKLFLFINVGTLIEWVKHLTIHNLTQNPIDIEAMRLKIIQEVGNDKVIGHMKCLNVDYTLLPMMTFVLKMIMIINDSKNTETDLNSLLVNILILAGYMIIVPFLYNLLKATTKLFNQID